MSLAGRYIGAGIAVARRDFLLYLSYRARFFGQLFGIFFTLTIYYYISRLVRVETFVNPNAYYAFVTIGLVIMTVLQSTMRISAMVRQELMAGTFERFVVSPFGPVAGTVSLLLYPFLEAVISAIILIGAGAIIFGLPIEWSTAPLALPVALLGTFAFAAIGLLFAGLVLVFKQASAGADVAVAGFTLIAGLYFPVALLPDWIQWASEVQPITPAADLLRHLLVGTPLREAAWLSVLKLTGFAATLVPLSIYLLHRGVRVSRRLGTIIEF